MSTTRHIVKSRGTIIGEVQSLTLPYKITEQEGIFTFKATSLVLRTKDMASAYFQLWTQQNGENLYYFKNCIVIGHGSPPYTRGEYTTYHNVTIRCEAVYTGRMLKLRAFW